MPQVEPQVMIASVLVRKGGDKWSDVHHAWQARLLQFLVNNEGSVKLDPRHPSLAIVTASTVLDDDEVEHAFRYMSRILDTLRVDVFPGIPVGVSDEKLFDVIAKYLIEHGVIK